MHIRFPDLQIFERFTDTAPDTADDDQRGLPSCRLSFQHGTIRRVKSVMSVMKKHEYTIAHFLLSLYTGFKNEQIDYKVLSYSIFRPS